MNLENPCKSYPLEFDLPEVFDFSEKTLMLGEEELSFVWSSDQNALTDQNINCGKITYELTKDDFAPIERSIFGFASNDISTQYEFKVFEANDVTMTGCYSFNLRAYPTDYPDLSTKDMLFTINIIDPNSLEAPKSQMDQIQVYTISRSFSKFQFDAFTALPASCKVSYEYEMDDPEGQLFVKAFDEETLTFTFAYLEDDLKTLKYDNKAEYRDFDITIIGTIGQVKASRDFFLRV